MKIRNIVIAAGLALASSAALAFHCPADMKATSFESTGCI